ncbi:MAG: hypothetical protein M1820_003337 [Bogoriella megaspora]|nr:MAG: hypothetical protein M1820_003337 [Bogoriella megaspora]
MSAIQTGAASCLCSFQRLAKLLRSAESRFRQLIPSKKLRDEDGRFRVWCSNLGALQKGHSSLDWRLRESQLMQSEVKELLKELWIELQECVAVASGVRPPYEESNPFRLNANYTNDDDDDNGEGSGYVSSEEQESDEEEASMPHTELQRRFSSICDIMSNMYKLSIRIRSPGRHERSLRAATYQETDPETNVDLLAQYAIFDRLYTKELF